MMTDNPDFDAEIRALMADGRKIEAIKRFREETGAGLAEAKHAVETLDRGEPLASAESVGSSMEDNIVSLLGQGRKIEAVKVYRAAMGVGLKEAKDAVEAIAADRGIAAPSGSGCLGVLLCLGVVIAGIAAV